MNKNLRFFLILISVITIGWVVVSNSYIQFIWDGACYIIDNSHDYSFEAQEPEKIQFTINISQITNYDKTEIVDFGKSKLIIESIRKENRLLRVIINASYKVKYNEGYIIQDLPSPDIAEITAVDQNGNQYEVIYNGAGPYNRNGREYHYLISLDEEMLPETFITITINNVVPIVYKRK